MHCPKGQQILSVYYTMSYFCFTDEEKEFRKTIARFSEKEIAPYADKIDEKEEFPVEWFKKAADLGLLGLRYPEKYGGSGAGFTFYLIAVEELAKASLSFASSVAMQSLMATDFIYRFASEEIKQKLLIPAIKGEKIGAFCLSEPNAGSDLGNIETVIKEEGNAWVLNGRKMWVTNGTIADFFTILASTDRKLGLKGVKFFLVEKGTSGLNVGKKIPKWDCVRPRQQS